MYAMDRCIVIPMPYGALYGMGITMHPSIAYVAIHDGPHHGPEQRVEVYLLPQRPVGEVRLLGQEQDPPGPEACGHLDKT